MWKGPGLELLSPALCMGMGEALSRVQMFFLSQPWFPFTPWLMESPPGLCGGFTKQRVITVCLQLLQDSCRAQSPHLVYNMRLSATFPVLTVINSVPSSRTEDAPAQQSSLLGAHELKHLCKGREGAPAMLQALENHGLGAVRETSGLSSPQRLPYNSQVLFFPIIPFFAFKHLHWQQQL